MISGGAVSIERSIQQERRMQHRSHHMIQMVDEGRPSLEMGVEENGKKVIVLKGSAKRAGISGHDSRDEHGAQACAVRAPSIHGAVILH